MSNYNWKSGVSGNWGLAGNWVQGSVANSTTADVTISSSSNIEVTIASRESFSADSVTLESTGVTLEVAGLLNLGGAGGQLVVGPGEMYIAFGGTIANGTIDAGTGVVKMSQYSTLDDITYVGDLNITGNNDEVIVRGGLKVENANGHGDGTINITGQQGILFIGSDETLDDIGINLGGAHKSGLDILSVGYNYLLTLGSHATVNSNTGNYSNELHGDIVNDGIINVAGKGLDEECTTFTNAGAVNVSASSTLSLESATINNTGVINVADGAGLVFNPAYFFGNAGVIDDAGTMTAYRPDMLTNLGTVSVASSGLLNLNGATLVVGSAELIDINGTITAGTIDTDAGGVVLNSRATLDNITYKGNLDVNGYEQYVNVVGALNVENATGSGFGTINLTGFGDSLNFKNSETLNHVRINLGFGEAGDDLNAGNGTLSLGIQTTINSAPITDDDNWLEGNAVVDDGIINVSNGNLMVDAATFTNLGTINVSGGALWLENSLNNVGVINVAAGADVGLDTSTPSSIGVIDAAGTVSLYTNLMLSNLIGISLSSGGLLDDQGDINLGGGTLAVAGNDNIRIGYKVSNGTINPSVGTLSFGPEAIFNDITYEGNLNFTANYQIFYISGGLKVLNASGGPGTINITDRRDRFAARDDETLNDVGINLGAAGKESDDRLGAESGFAGYGYHGSGYSLTLGSNATVNSNSTVDRYFYGANYIYGVKVVNDGVINLASGGLIIDPKTFDNAGTINVSAGSTLVVAPQYVTNFGLVEGVDTGIAVVNVAASVKTKKDTFFGTTLNGGGFEANPGDVLALNLKGTIITVDDGELILNGAGSQIEEYSASAGGYVSVESTLRTIGSGGTLAVLGGRNYTTGKTLDIAGGTLILGGGTFTAESLNLSKNSSQIIGYGTIEDAITNSGIIGAAGGTLVIVGSLSGAGALVIGASSTLELTTGSSENVKFFGTDSQLTLDSPVKFSGTLCGLEAGDSINLIGEMASSASISGTSLLVTLTNNTKLDYTLATTLPLEGVSVSSDGGTGSELIFYQLPTAAAAMQFIRPPAATAAMPAPASTLASLPALLDLWSGATNYRPNFAVHSGQASFTNPQHLQTELGNMPTPTNAGIVLPGPQNWELARSPYHDLALALPKG